MEVKSDDRFITSILLPIGIITLSFILSRVFYLLVLHTQFNSGTLTYYWQFIDPLLLKTDLLRSIYYLGFQPPLFNLFLGLILKLFPVHYHYAFQAAYLLMGWIFGCSLFLLMEKMGVGRKIALTLAIIHIVSPTTILYENWLFYAYPIAMLLCISALALCIFLQSGRLFHGIIFFSLLALQGWICSFYHIFWVAFISLVLIGIYKVRRKVILWSCALPFLMIFLLTIKQFVLFGEYVPSQSFGLWPDISVRIQNRVPSEIREQLLESKQVPIYYFVNFYQNFSVFEPYLPPIPPTGIPVLDQKMKSTNAINFNYFGYFYAAPAYKAGFITLLRLHPEYYLSSFNPTIRYFFPANEDKLAQGPNASESMNALIHSYNMWVCGQWERNTIGWSLLLSFPFLIAFGLFRCIIHESNAPLYYSASLFFMLVNVLYLTGLTVSVPFCDYNRYRFYIDAFYLVLLGMVFTEFWNYIRQWHSRGRPSAS